MIRPILLASSGDADSDWARRAAANLVAASGAPLHVVVAWDVSHLPGGLGPVFHAADAAHRLDVERQLLAGGGVTVAGTHLAQGSADTRILEIADELGAQLIITGGRGGGPLQRLFRHSVSEATVRHSDVPVLVVPAGPRPWPPAAVLVADSGADDGSALIATGAWMAALLRIPLSVVHVRDGHQRAGTAWAVTSRVDALEERLHLAIERVSAEGHPAAEVVRAAEQRAALVVIGRRSSGAVDASRPERVSDQVLRTYHAACLVVPRSLPGGVRRRRTVPKRRAAASSGDAARAR